MNKSWEDKVVWITGASSGIGEALVREFAKRKARIILSGRREKELERVAKENALEPSRFLVMPMDLERNESFEGLVQKAMEEFGRLDVLIHNGGISQRSLTRDTNLSVFKKLMDVNFLGTVSLTLSALPIFREQKNGHLVVISSIVGKIGTPLRSGYSASKHALHGFFEALRAEEWRSNLKVLMVCPGFIQTQVSVNALSGDGTPHGEMDLATANGIPVEVCAEKILRGIEKNKEEILVAGKKEKMGVFLKRFFPALLSRIMRKAKVT